MFLGQATVMRGDRLIPQAFGECSGGPFRQTARIHKDERGAVVLGQLGQAIIDLGPDLIGHHRLQG